MAKIYGLAMLMITAFVSEAETAAAARDPRAFLREESEIYLQAFLEKDYDTCLKMMGGEIVRDLGGKIAVLNHYQATEAALKLHKLKPETITVGDPGPVIKVGANEQYVVIPEKHCFSGKDGNYLLDSYILAISEDGGKTWNMIEGSWRLSEHIKNKNLILYDRLRLPVRKIYLAEDPRLMMLEKGGGFYTPPETLKYKQSLRQRNNPLPAQPVRLGR